MRRPLPIALALLATAYGAWAAVRGAWLCDDAFISFRYADNLVHGLGLVYNAGERVEGYSNFLWTLGVAVGMRLGVAPEAWSMVLGVLFFVGTLAILLADAMWPEGGPAVRAARAARPRTFLPLACVLVALHPDAQRFATGGLETSLFTFLVTAGYLLATRPSLGLRGTSAAGLVFGLVALTRPDGLLFAPLVALGVAWSRRPRWEPAAVFVACLLAVWLPAAALKAAYYGDVFPNTYYAKSANLAWYSQGLEYARLYFQRYVVLALAIPAAFVALSITPSAGRRTGAPREDVGLALTLAVAYIAFVIRVGGDFMYARLLVPVAPLLAIVLARSVARLAAGRAAAEWSVGAAAAVAIAIAPAPISGGEVVQGIADEANIYTADVTARARAHGRTLQHYFDGLPVTVAIVGSQASLAYYARPRTVIEAGAGLTDRTLAHRPLERRGRVGHEKQADVAYLLDRQVDFTLGHFSGVTLGLDASLPNEEVWFDTIPGRIVHWNPMLLAELRRRGARFFDLPGSLDFYCASLDRLSDEQVREAYAKMQRFYFAFVPDSVHERAFLERLARARPVDSPAR